MTRKTIEVKKVLKVDLNKKTLLLITITDSQYFDWAEDIVNHLHEWMAKENTPICSIAIPDGIEIKLEQIEPDDADDAVGIADLALRVSRLEDV